MRPTLFVACLVALVGIPIAPGFAEDADCDMLCRMKGYLTSDHMAAQPAGVEAPAPAKQRRIKKPVAVKQVVAVKKPAAAPEAKAAVKPAERTLAGAPVAKAAPRPSPVETPAAARVHPEPVKRVASARPAKPPRAAPIEVAPAAPAPVLAAAPAPRRPAPLREARAPKPSRAAQASPPRADARPDGAPSTETITAAALIPGSAPPMPAGFQPVGSGGLR